MERHTEQDPKRLNTFNDIENQIDFLYDDIWEKKLKNIKEYGSVVEMDNNPSNNNPSNNSILPECLTNEIITKFIAIYEQKLDLTVDKQTRFNQFKEI